MTSYAKLKNEMEFDVKHITLYTKGQPVQFNNHGSLCIEKFNKDLKYKTDFIHLGSVILCSTSYSPEITVLVCDDIEKNVNSWYQLMLLDNNRLELPITLSGDQTLSKGMIMYFGNERKMFKINDTEVIGGPKFPLIMIINSEGILCNFYASYALQGKLTDPVVYPTKQLEFQFLPQQQQTVSNQQSAFHQQTPTKYNVPPQQQQQTPQQAQHQPNLVPQQQQQQQQQQVVQLTNEQIQQIKQIQQAQKVLQEQEKIIAQQKQAAKEAELQKEKERRQIMEENHAYLIAIEEEVFQFTKIICESKEKYSKSNNQIVGKEEEKRNLVDLTEALENDLSQVNESLKGLDIELLENFLLENLAMAQDARLRLERDNDSKLNILFKKRPLDALTERKLKEINNKKIYIETNLKEIDYILDQQWHDYIVSGKGKKLDSVSPLSLIHQTIANNNRTLNSLKNQLRVLEPALSWKDPNQKLNFRKNEIKKLASKLSRTRLDETEFDNVNYDSDDDKDESGLVEIKRFTKESRQNLVRILDARPEIPLKRSSLPVDMNSSIMISAISKAKEKLKSAKKQIEKNHMKQTLVRNQMTANQMTTSNKKQIEQFQQHQSIQKSPQPVRHQQQVKTTSTFMPPTILNQPNIIPQANKSPQLSASQQQIAPKQLIPRQVPNKVPVQQQNIASKLPPQPTVTGKPIASSQPQSIFNPANKGEPFKFSFDGNLGIDKNKPIAFGQPIDQSKSQLPTKQTSVIQPQQQIKPTPIQQTTSNTASIFTAQQTEQKPVDFPFKSTADQLNLTFEKSSLNLMSSTPIKNQMTEEQIQAQQLQKQIEASVALASKANIRPLFSNSSTLNQLNKVVETTTSNAAKPTIIQSKYEEVSPANTPTIDSKQQQKTPVTLQASTKPSDPSVFSFDTLAAISKMPVSTVFSSNTTPIFGQANTSTTTTPLSNKPENLQNVQNNQQQQQSQNKTETSNAPATVSTANNSLLSTNKTIFGQGLTTPLSSANNQSLSFNTTQGSMSIFSPDKQPQTTTTSIFTNTLATSTVQQQPNTLFGKPVDSGSGFKFGTIPTTTSATSSVTAAQNTTSTTTNSSFSMNLTSGFLNLASPKKDTTNQLPTSSSLSIQQPSTLSSQQPQAVSQQPQAVSQPSIFSPVTCTATQSPLSQQQTSGFGNFSMCSLGGKPNPENVNKNPFGSSLTATSTPSTGLFGSSQPPQQGLFTSLASNQTASPAFATTPSSPFSATTSQTSAFGTTSAFGQQPQTNAFSPSNQPIRTAFGQPSGFSQPQQSPMSSGFGQQSSFGQTSAFGSKSTFGQSPNSSFGSGGITAPAFTSSQTVFGANSSIAAQTNSFSALQAPKTGFNR